MYWAECQFLVRPMAFRSLGLPQGLIQLALKPHDLLVPCPQGILQAPNPLPKLTKLLSLMLPGLGLASPLRLKTPDSPLNLPSELLLAWVEPNDPVNPI